MSTLTQLRDEIVKNRLLKSIVCRTSPSHNKNILKIQI
uniref:Uncharacterized protein n=1 Tax=Anguilla anguilla TaxID=7936 RepID=A0A0E9Q954_ANGAN